MLLLLLSQLATAIYVFNETPPTDWSSANTHRVCYVSVGTTNQEMGGSGIDKYHRLWLISACAYKCKW